MGSLFVILYMMRKVGDNMKTLNDYCNDLCERLTKATHEKWKHTIGKTEFTYKEGQKYIKIISNDNDGYNTSVWGFINKSNSKFNEGDILKARLENACLKQGKR